MNIDQIHVGKYSVTPTSEPLDALDIDPRGILWVYEQPNPNASYVIGCDPTFGISGWSRALRTKDDSRTDNAAIEVFRRGNGVGPDVQVAEWVAPIDAESLAPICNMIGRMYSGNDEDGMALMCLEVYPGTGWMTKRELISRYGYFHQPPWLVEGHGITLKETNKIGWYSTRSTRQDLWTRGITHLTKQRVILRSPYLLDEMADCTPDSFLSSTGRARNGLHDDRVVASLIALWYCVPPDTLVTLANGTRLPIAYIRPGDFVLGRAGEEQVKGVYIHYKNGSLVELDISGSYDTLRCTPEHKILVQRQRDKRGNRKCRNKPGSPLEWIPAKDVKSGYRVLIPARFDLPQSRFTEDQLYLMGWYLAEGFTHRNTINLTLGPHEEDVAKRLMGIINEWMKEQPKYRGSKTLKARLSKARTSLIVSFSSPVLSTLFREHLGCGSHHKRLSPELFSSSGLLPLVKGWIEGDGHVTRFGQSIVATVSSTLAHQMRQVLLNHGIWNCIQKRTLTTSREIEGRPLPDTTYYGVHIGIGWYKKLYGKPFGKETERYQQVTIVPEGFLTPIRSVGSIPYGGPVYDIETDKHTFTASGIIIHNCNEWSLNIDPSERDAAEVSTGTDYQRTIMTSTEMMDDFDDRLGRILD